MSGTNPDYNKRGFSLPPGCKDLIVVLELENSQLPRNNVVETGNRETVKNLATLLGRKPFQIIADLLELKIMANVDRAVTFEVAARVAAKYGFMAKSAT